MLRVLKGLLICLIAAHTILLPISLIHAQDPEQPDPALILPHLGYGIHFGPHTNVPAPQLVNQLGFDWVKIYELGHAWMFPSKRILLRVDIGWQSDWAGFKRGFAEQVRQIAAAPVDAVEIHNEPNLRNEWGGSTPNAWQYTQLLRVAYTVIKQIKPSLIVVSGGLAPTVTTPDRGAISDLDFAREMFENGAGQWFDAFGYHPYGYNLPPEAEPGGNQPLVFRRTEQIRALMEEYGIYKQVWLTEFGWLRDPSEDGVGCSDSSPDFHGFAWMRVSGAQQADYLVRAFEYAHLNWPWAGPMFVWNLNWQQMNWLNPCSHMRWFGLLNTKGEPTPAFKRLAAMKRYPSSYQPRIEIRSAPIQGTISLICPRRIEIGSFTVENTGYPVGLLLDIEPFNRSAPYIEALPTRARIGEKITLYADPGGVSTPGTYPVFINVRGTYQNRPISQSLQGVVQVWHMEVGCSG